VADGASSLSSVGAPQVVARAATEHRIRALPKLLSRWA
jgi:hypothetical protein